MTDVKYPNVLIRINGNFVGTFCYTWNQAKDVLSVEQIAYLRWGAESFREHNHGVWKIRNAKYNVLKKAVTKYPDDDIRNMIKTIHAKIEYKDIKYNRRIY